MGYCQLGELTPHSSVLFHKEENEYGHPWSVDSLGYRYGFGKLHDIIPFSEYLKLPCHLVDNLMAGISKGMKDRDALDKETNPPPEGGNGLSKEEKELMELVKKLNLSKP